jgi:hypothetical protein
VDFGEVLGRAWKITWKFKVLWIFGILAGCGTGSGSNFNSSSSSYQTNGNTNPNLPPGFAGGINQFVRSLTNPTVSALIVGFICLICLIFLVSIFLSQIGRIGLIKGTAEADEGAEKISFRALWKSSLQYFWRFFWLSILVGLPFFIIILILAVGFLLAFVPAIQGANSGAAVAGMLGILSLVCLVGCVFFLFAIVVGFVVRQAENAIVLENQTILGSLQRGWEVFKKNIGPILIIWLITVGISLAGRLVISLPILVILIPVFLAFFSTGSSGTISYVPLIIAGLIFLGYLPIAIVAGGILMTYVESVWTLTFLRLTKPQPAETASTPIATNA